MTRQLFKNQLIKNKILFIYIPLVIIPLFLLGFISNYIFSQAIIRETVKNVADNSTLIVTRINTVIANTENCANITTLSLIKLIQNNLNYGDDSISYFEMSGKIENELSIIKLTFPDVESSGFIDKDLNAFTSDIRLTSNINEVPESEIYKKVSKSSPENMWFPLQKRNFLVTDAKEPVLTLAKKVIDPRNGKKLGILALNIKENAISDIYSSVGPESITSYFILDGQGKIVSSQNKDDVLQPLRNIKLRQLILSRGDFNEIKNFNGKDMLVTSASLQYFGWKLVTVIPIQELTADINKNTVVVVMLGFMCMILALFFATLLSKVIAKPLIILTKKMDEIKDGNLDIVCNVSSEDEIGRLASGFNIMVERIKELLNKSTQEQKKLREYELALIQAQIKPHFLYNSLELVYTLCGMAGANEAQIATKSLADFYRVALSKGKEIITIEEEMKNVNDYLNIQRYRYFDVFNYEIKIQEEIKKSKILKLTLQPLVENSIYHGLKAKGSFGSILIEGYLDDDNVLIKVTDDGVGMSDNKISEIFGCQHSEAAKESFGLRSVDERIKLFFGEEYGLKIESEPGKGTLVTVRIPLLNGGSEYAENNRC